MPVVASFHLTRYPARHALGAMAGVVTRRRALAATPGLRFARQLGTGSGSAMALGADLHRWATFAVWDGDEALGAFLATSPLARTWAELGEETWTVRLAPLSSHGSWGGQQPFAADPSDSGGGDPDRSGQDGGGGPVAVLTRARVALRHWPAFYRSVAAVEDHLRRQAGLLAVVGIGEAPLGLQATFSLWRSAAEMTAFAYRDSPHEEVVRRTRAEGWFTEELFARFRPYRSTGTWDGTDPLAGAGAGRRPPAGGNGS
ncbi:MAG: spheroidene monooxygenase [Acidimicrobiales bacterium]